MDNERKEFQVLVFPFRVENNRLEYCLLKRADLAIWQGVAGGGEYGETSLQSAIREAEEEGNIKGKFVELKSICYMPSVAVNKEYLKRNIVVIPEYSFGVEFNGEITLSHEHTEFKWVTYEEAKKLLFWDSNKTALWELNYFIRNRLYKEKIEKYED